MSKAKNPTNLPLGVFGATANPARVAEKMAHLRSGAAGVHADQNARVHRSAGRTNRIGSRSAQRASAVQDFR